MKKADFIACSLAFHVALFLLALLLPPPFPSPRPDDGGLTYVELANPAEKGGGRPAGPAYPSGIQDGITFAHKGGPSAPPEPAGADTPAQPVSSEEDASGPRPSAIRAAAPAAQPASGPAPSVAVTGETGDRGVKADKTSLSFKYQRGWPPPGMVKLRLDSLAGDSRAAGWRARKGADWLIVSPASGRTPATLSIGVDVSRLAVGFYEAAVEIIPDGQGIEGEEISVTLMVLPKSAGQKELPHTSWDSYMNGSCKVCHLPEAVMPSKDFMTRPEFCALCHNPNGIAGGRLAGAGGHPVLVPAGAGGTKRPTRGSVASGPKSDRMDTHLPGGMVVCVTCHNVMEKTAEYGRAWELASSTDGREYRLAQGGWEGMGHITPRAYVTPSLMPMPKELKEAARYLAPRGSYVYDESEGAVIFKAPRGKNEVVYVTLTNPYLRVTAENNALCHDCHHENTHQGLNCLDCHVMHGTANRKCVAPALMLPGKGPKKVVFRAKSGKNSFADGGGDGICEACHPLPAHKDGKTHAGEDCTLCHPHRDGF